MRKVTSESLRFAVDPRLAPHATSAVLRGLLVDVLRPTQTCACGRPAGQCAARFANTVVCPRRGGSQ